MFRSTSWLIAIMLVATIPQSQTSAISTAQSCSGWQTGTALPVSLGEIASGMIDNKLYVVGEANPSTAVYDLTTKTWTTVAQRAYTGNHHAAEVINGKLYLFGGLGAAGGNAKLQIYDPATDTWSLGADLPFGAGSGATALITGKVYLAGGIVYNGNTGSTTNRVAMYDPVLNTWTEKAAMPQGRNHAAAATDGAKMYVFGGRGFGSGDDNVVANGFNTLQMYDPATNTWQSSANAGSTLAPLPQARGGMGKAVYFEGEFYVMGGETLDGAGATSNKVYNRVDIYNPTTNMWRLGAHMPTARHGVFPILANGNIYVAAGGTKAGYSNSTVLEIFVANGCRTWLPLTVK